MPKFKVEGTERLFYISREIEAQTREEAEDTYLDMIDRNEVGVSGSEDIALSTEEVK